MGDIFRWNIQAHTKLAARIKRIVDAGDLVSDEIVEQIVRERLDMHDWNYGFILDGFPRSESQALFFLESYDIDAVVYIDVPDGVCDVCGGTLVAREDDTEEALKQRLHDFTTQTKPTLDLFERKERVVTVAGQGTPSQVQAAIRDGLSLG